MLIYQTSISSEKIFKQLSHMEQRPKMYGKTVYEWHVAYDTLLRLLFVFDEKSHDRFNKLYMKFVNDYFRLPSSKNWVELLLPDNFDLVTEKSRLFKEMLLETK